MKKCKEILQKILVWSRKAPALPRKAVIAGLLFCCLIAAGLRGLRLHAEPVLSVDGAVYVLDATTIADGKTEKKDISFSPHEFFGAYLASGIFNASPHRLGIATNILLGSLLPLLIFGLAKQLFHNDEIALWCALLSAVHPKLVMYSIEVQREIPYLFFCTFFFLFAVLYLQTRKWYWNCAMALGAVLSFCSRYEGLELLPLTAGLYVFCFIRERETRRQTLCGLGLFSVCTVLFFVILLWCLDLSGIGVIKNTLMKLRLIG